MTTAEPPAPARPTDLTRPLLATISRNGRWLNALSLLAIVVGIQSLVASAPLAAAVRLLLPSEGLLAGLGDGLRRGYSQAMAEGAACGVRTPALELGWLEPGVDPQPALSHAARNALLIAPPAADLAAYGRLAQQQRLSVLLPLQRGRSLDGLAQLPGSDRLWPVLPSRSLEADRLAEGLLSEGRRRVMVVRDPSADSLALAKRFEASFSNGRGSLIGVDGAVISLAGGDQAGIDQLVRDVDWYRPDALVILTGSHSTLAKSLRRASWPEGLLLAWTAAPLQPLGQPQLGVDPQSRGSGWQAFSQRFNQRWGYRPGLVESAGYDTGLIALLASLPVAGRPGWDLHWLNARAKPLPLCAALQQRQLGASVRPQAATSGLDLAPGVSPRADLRLHRLASSTTAPPPP
ncbi:MAG: hypothetical protein RLZZ137_2140 [Cyanobacteriota bacterium]|jgi:hypothetical protein